MFRWSAEAPKRHNARMASWCVDGAFAMYRPHLAIPVWLQGRRHIRNIIPMSIQVISMQMLRQMRSANPARRRKCVRAVAAAAGG